MELKTVNVLNASILNGESLTSSPLVCSHVILPMHRISGVGTTDLNRTYIWRNHRLRDCK